MINFWRIFFKVLILDEMNALILIFKKKLYVLLSIKLNMKILIVLYIAKQSMNNFKMLNARFIIPDSQYLFARKHIQADVQFRRQSGRHKRDACTHASLLHPPPPLARSRGGCQFLLFCENSKIIRNPLSVGNFLSFC